MGLSFALEGDRAYYIPVGHNYLGVESQLPMDSVLSTLKPLLEDPQLPKYGQNIKYDILVLRYKGIYVDKKTTKAFKPKQKDVKILTQGQVYYPIWNISLDYRGTEFVRKIDGIQGKIISQSQLKCEECGKTASFLCSNCGAPLCAQHNKQCEICGKIICKKNECRKTKGKILKKNYCVSCA